MTTGPGHQPRARRQSTVNTDLTLRGSLTRARPTTTEGTTNMDQRAMARGSLRYAATDLRLQAAQELQAQGWTQDSAMDHLEGSCDRAICCGWPDDLPAESVTISDQEFFL